MHYSFLTNLSKLFTTPTVRQYPSKCLLPSPFYISIEEQQEVATVSSSIQLFSPGQVEYQGKFWTAMCCQNVVIKENQLVRVVGRKDLILIVEPLSSADDNCN
jgi:membrane protein implicated in regulation of membrane protease activity